jgi:hypothetical protein
MNKQLRKYLNTRAITSPWNLEGEVAESSYKAAIVIPALAELQTLPQTLTALSANPAYCLRQTLIVVVVNNRQSSSAIEKEDNLLLLAWLKGASFPDLNLAWVDASSDKNELPLKEGVGLVRKIGFDLSLTQLDWSGAPLLISLDADTLVDSDYLPAIFAHFRQSQCGAAVLPFYHQPGETEPQEKAIRTYELFLRSYLLGLQLAGSPYAYHTIGSALACTAYAYVAAGGMNRRHAGEDFYFLQQLAKVTGVEILEGTIVHPSPRFSDRVPFGTGRAVQAQVFDGEQLFNCTSGPAFQVLKNWLDLVANNVDQSPDSLLEEVGVFSHELHDFLVEYKFKSVWTAFQAQYSDRQRLLKAFHDWFDALKTRQVLTRCDRDNGEFSSQRVASMLSWGGYRQCENSDQQLALLEQLQLNKKREHS